MSTRSLIGLKQDKQITFIYNHFDGYIEGVGEFLYKKYKSEEKIKKLISKGNASSVISDEFYNEKDINITDSEKSYIAEMDNFDAEYIYLFKNSDWYVSRGGRFKLLKEEIRKNKK